jgi:hypothetical protein
MTRRRLLWLSGTTVALTALPTRVRVARAAQGGGWLRRSAYTGRIGETFHVRLSGGGRLRLRLASVSDLQGATIAGAPLAGRDDAFCVTLNGASAPPLAQGTYRLSHPALGRAALFLVPGRGDAREATYQLVVHRAEG